MCVCVCVRVCHLICILRHLCVSDICFVCVCACDVDVRCATNNIRSAGVILNGYENKPLNKQPDTHTNMRTHTQTHRIYTHVWCRVVAGSSPIVSTVRVVIQNGSKLAYGRTDTETYLRGHIQLIIPDPKHTCTSYAQKRYDFLSRAHI